MGMRQILVIMAAVMRLSVVAGEVVITDPVLKEAIGVKLEKPYGEFAPPIKLTEAEAAKVAELILSNTKITDAGLKEVAKLQQLELLYLSDTNVTEAGVAELEKALPKCDISSSASK